MRVKMTNKRFKGAATPLEADVPTWEAAGWVVAEKPITKTKKEDEK